jgi:hypothetical protein
MSELINATSHSGSIRRTLLATASAFALLASVGGIGEAKAGDDTGPPNVWIELGGQMEQFAPTQELFSPPFLLKTPPTFETVTPLDAEKPPRFAIGGDANLTFEPAGTHWVFSASVRYGRSNGNKLVQQETAYPSQIISTYKVPPYLDNYATSKIRHDESHAIIDFQAGKDFGLGLFGRKGISTVSLGARFAQFASITSVDIRERPDMHVKPGGLPLKYYHNYHLTGHSARNFHALGPSISWNASAPFAGNPDSTEFIVDWGINAAVLFGRQKTAVSHHTSGSNNGEFKYHIPYTNSPPPRDSTRSVTIPNVGGFVGISVKRSIAKVSLGYRADFFFGAVDGGIDKRVSKTLGLNGPYASISVGL